jgi:hypothetical protein
MLCDGSAIPCLMQLRPVFVGSRTSIAKRESSAVPRGGTEKCSNCFFRTRSNRLVGIRTCGFAIYHYGEPVAVALGHGGLPPAPSTSAATVTELLLRRELRVVDTAYSLYPGR